MGKPKREANMPRTTKKSLKDEKQKGNSAITKQHPSAGAKVKPSLKKDSTLKKRVEIKCESKTHHECGVKCV